MQVVMFGLFASGDKPAAKAVKSPTTRARAQPFAEP